MKLNTIKEQDGATRTVSGLAAASLCRGRFALATAVRKLVQVCLLTGLRRPDADSLPSAKRGFNNIFRKNYVEVNLDRIQTALDAGNLDKQPVDALLWWLLGLSRKPVTVCVFWRMGRLRTRLKFMPLAAKAAAVNEKAGARFDCRRSAFGRTGIR